VVFPTGTGDDEHTLEAVLSLTDVMGTGHHAGVSTGVEAGSTCAVVDDGAVGLCGVLVARRRAIARVNHVLECFGAASAMETATGVCRPGGTVDYVGLARARGRPRRVRLLRRRHLAPRRSRSGMPYVEELMADVLQGGAQSLACVH
jgi:alcohol dehydrogenase